MSWLKLTSEALYLMEGANSTNKVDVTKVDGDTLSLDVPLSWLRQDDAPRQMIVSLKSTTQPSSGTPTTTPTWKDTYAGLEINGSNIPRKGLSNPTLGELEPFGDVVQFAGLDFVKGKVSWFGGKDDDGVTQDETGSLTGEPLRKLGEPPFDDKKHKYYCAMRFSFTPNGKNFWANQKILVINPINQRAIVVRAIDWGPNTSTKRVIDLSKQALDELGAETDDDLLCAFANNSQDFGLI